MEKINLINFGMEVLGYKNENNCVRYFVSKVNAFLELDEDNNSATKKELIRYSVASNNKTFKEWAKKEMDLLLSEDLTGLVREKFVLKKKETLSTPKKATKSTTTDKKDVEKKEKAKVDDKPKKADVEKTQEVVLDTKAQELLLK